MVKTKLKDFFKDDEEDEEEQEEDQDEEFASKEKKFIKQVGWPVDKEDLIIGILILGIGLFVGYLVAKSIYRRDNTNSGQCHHHVGNYGNNSVPSQQQLSPEAQDIISNIMNREQRGQYMGGYKIIDQHGSYQEHYRGRKSNYQENWVIERDEDGAIVDCYRY